MPKLLRPPSVKAGLLINRKFPRLIHEEECRGLLAGDVAIMTSCGSPVSCLFRLRGGGGSVCRGGGVGGGGRHF